MHVQEESDNGSSGSDYSEKFARQRATRRSARIRQKDRDFVVSDSDPDYEEPRRSETSHVHVLLIITPLQRRAVVLVAARATQTKAVRTR